MNKPGSKIAQRQHPLLGRRSVLWSGSIAVTFFVIQVLAMELHVQLWRLLGYAAFFVSLATEVIAAVGIVGLLVATLRSLGLLKPKSRKKLKRKKLKRKKLKRRRNSESWLVPRLTDIALFVAGRRRAYLRDPWTSDLLGQNGQALPVRRQLRHATGYFVAAIQFRLVNDLGEALGKILDDILISRGRTAAAVVTLFAIPAEMVLARQGLYGLVTNAGSLGIIGGALCAAVNRARAWRGVQPPKRDKQKDRSR